MLLVAGRELRRGIEACYEAVVQLRAAAESPAARYVTGAVLVVVVVIIFGTAGRSLLGFGARIGLAVAVDSVCAIMLLLPLLWGINVAVIARQRYLER